MTATTLDGKLYRAELFEDLKKRVAALDKQPGLATVLVGEDPGSHSYVKMKHRDCEELGIASIRKDLPEDTPRKSLKQSLRSSTPMTMSPATSSSCRCRSISTKTASWN